MGKSEDGIREHGSLMVLGLGVMCKDHKEALGAEGSPLLTASKEMGLGPTTARNYIRLRRPALPTPRLLPGEIPDRFLTYRISR